MKVWERLFVFDTIHRIQYVMNMDEEARKRAFENFVPKGNPPSVTQSTPQEVSFIPDMDDAQLRKLAREKLSRALQAISPTDQPEMTRKLCAELMDRIDGKPTQAVTMNADLKVVTVNANINFIPAGRDNLIDAAVDNLQVIDN